MAMFLVFRYSIYRLQLKIDIWVFFEKIPLIYENLWIFRMSVGLSVWLLKVSWCFCLFYPSFSLNSCSIIHIVRLYIRDFFFLCLSFSVLNIFLVAKLLYNYTCPSGYKRQKCNNMETQFSQPLIKTNN